MAKIGLNLMVTFRPNIQTSERWQYVHLDDALDYIANDIELRERYHCIRETFIEIEGWKSSDEQEEFDDYMIRPNLLHEPGKTHFRKEKLALPCLSSYK